VKCYRCGGRVESAVKIINYKWRSSLINVSKCVKCEHTYTPLDEAEKARLNLNPSIIERLKGIFTFNAKITEAILKGKVL